MRREETILSIATTGHSDMINISRQVASAVQKSGAENGICVIYCPHTTCALTINENADPDVQRDMIYELDRIVPWSDGYHHSEGNSAAHIKASMYGFSQSIPICNGSLPLGTWQGIYLCEFDGPRQRRIRIEILS